MTTVQHPLLLECDRPLLDGASSLLRLEAEGPQLGLLGDWSWLFALAEGRQQLHGGRLELVGVASSVAVASGALGMVTGDENLPRSWRVRTLLRENAQLLGHSAREASRLARQALDTLGLDSLAPRKLGDLDAARRRGVALALALLGDPPAIALDRPLAGLAPSHARRVAPWVAAALRGRQALVGVAAIGSSPEEDALLQSLDELLVLSDFRGGFVRRGTYSELCAGTDRYRLVVSRHADALRDALRSLGYESHVTSARQPGAVTVGDPRGQGTAPLLGAAARVDAPVLELLPHGFAGSAP